MESRSQDMKMKQIVIESKLLNMENKNSKRKHDEDMEKDGENKKPHNDTAFSVSDFSAESTQVDTFDVTGEVENIIDARNLDISDEKKLN